MINDREPPPRPRPRTLGTGEDARLSVKPGVYQYFTAGFVGACVATLSVELVYRLIQAIPDITKWLAGDSHGKYLTLIGFVGFVSGIFGFYVFARKRVNDD